MDDEYYPATDGMAAPSEPAEPEAPETPDSSEASQEEDQGTTALIPKSLLAGKEVKPGDTFTFKVVHIYEDEIEVEDAGEGGEGEEAPPTADEEIDAMNTEKGPM